MKANELRYGNLVGFNNSDMIVELDEDHFYDFKTHGCRFDPIPLTEEWVDKFGFKKNERNRWCIAGHSYALFWYEYIATGDDHRMWRIEYHNTDYGQDKYEDCHQMADRIKYVHQLQNLYFALTGKELTIKND